MAVKLLSFLFWPLKMTSGLSLSLSLSPTHTHTHTHTHTRIHAYAHTQCYPCINIKKCCWCVKLWLAWTHSIFIYMFRHQAVTLSLSQTHTHTHTQYCPCIHINICCWCIKLWLACKVWNSPKENSVACFVLGFQSVCLVYIIKSLQRMLMLLLASHQIRRKNR